MMLGVVKTGNIASSLVLELLLDERAERRGLDVKALGSGAKMTPEACKAVAEELGRGKYDLILYVTPNPGAPGPRIVVDALAGKRAIVVGDSPGIKIKDELEKKGLGYIFVTGDALIGARREFLDPIEMGIFNGDVLKVLSVTGAFRALHEAIDKVIEAKGRGELPRLIIDAKVALASSGIRNPYALAKARAAYAMVEAVASLNAEACFSLKEPADYIQAAAAAHEMMRQAARLADEAREMEKYGDHVARRPHAPEGALLKKLGLMDKPGST